jgi:hypothetical protein
MVYHALNVKHVIAFARLNSLLQVGIVLSHLLTCGLAEGESPMGAAYFMKLNTLYNDRHFSIGIIVTAPFKKGPMYVLMTEVLLR